MSKKKRMRGSVQKVIKSVVPGEPEKAQIGIEEGDELYREIRIENEEGDELYREIRVENVVTNEKGEQAHLKPGAKVDVVVEADSDATTKKPD
jgi:hypothetical protein